MCPPPKPKKPVAPPPPVEAPEVELGSENQDQSKRALKRRGRNKLRTGLEIASGPGGLQAPAL